MADVVTPNGWRHNREWHNAHYFHGGRSLCGLDVGTMPTKMVTGRQNVSRCSKCRDEYAGQLHLVAPNGQSVLDLIGEHPGPPIAP